MALSGATTLASTVALATLSVATAASPLRALEPAEVRAKFSEIVVLAPVDSSGVLRTTPNAGVIAALSPDAAVVIQKRWLANDVAGKRQSPLRFQRMSLTDFESAALELRRKNPDLAITYVPDPEQQDISGELLQQQGVQASAAIDKAAREIFAFCPDPLIRISTSANPGNQPNVIVPCALDFTTIAILVNRSNLTSQSSTVVKAYSLPELLAFLGQQSGPDAQNLKILPMPWAMNSQAAQAAN